MKGLYFINDRHCLNGNSKQESFLIQEQAIKKFIHEQKIQVTRLNPYQINEFYTIPHALLYDLKKQKIQYDYFLYYSPQVLEDFIYSYPAKWLILKSFFHEIITIEDQSQLHIWDVI